MPYDVFKLFSDGCRHGATCIVSTEPDADGRFTCEVIPHTDGTWSAKRTYAGAVIHAHEIAKGYFDRSTALYSLKEIVHKANSLIAKLKEG